MQGNKCDQMIDILADEYGMGAICNHEIDFAEALYSDGFINAVENGLIPNINDVDDCTSNKKGDKEYHHIIINDKCFIMYFS